MFYLLVIIYIAYALIFVSYLNYSWSCLTSHGKSSEVFPVHVYLSKVNLRKSIKLRLKTPERRRCGVFIVNFEHILQLFLVFLLLALNKWMLASFLILIRGIRRSTVSISLSAERVLLNCFQKVILHPCVKFINLILIWRIICNWDFNGRKLLHCSCVVIFNFFLLAHWSHRIGRSCCWFWCECFTVSHQRRI